MNSSFLQKKTLVAGAILSFTATLVSAQNTDDTNYRKLEADLNKLRQQMSIQQQDHAREIADLKARLPQSSASSTNTPPPTAIAKPTLYESMKQSSAALLPQAMSGKGADLDLSVVLDMNFYHTDADEGIGALRGGLQGMESTEEAEGPENGFNLREVELGLSAEVDPYFRAWATVAVDEEGAGFEEATLQTTSLPYGLTLSGGKIKSGIGRLNRQHAHAWDFLDAPLVYQAMFGDEGLSDKGVQLTWLVPTPFYLLLGTEVFNGGNAQSFNVADSEEMPHHDAPRLFTAFVKAGPDLGPNHALQFGLSALSGRQQRWTDETSSGADGFSRLFGADFVYKYDAKHSHGQGDFILQGEYLYRDQDLDGVTEWSESSWTAQQDGYYVQGLYGFLPRWRSGFRWDQVGLVNEVNPLDDEKASYDDSRRLSAVLDCKLSEFSLVRTQIGQGWYETDAGCEKAFECALQWQVTFGKHGAHDF